MGNREQKEEGRRGERKPVQESSRESQQDHAVKTAQTRNSQTRRPYFGRLHDNNLRGTARGRKLKKVI